MKSKNRKKNGSEARKKQEKHIQANEQNEHKRQTTESKQKQQIALKNNERAKNSK
jgi:hypothetical protein